MLGDFSAFGMRNRYLLPLLAFALFPMSEEIRSDTPKVSLRTEGQTQAGYDSNICLRRKPHPSPVKEECRQEGAFFWGLAGAVAVDAHVTDWCGFELEPQLLFDGLFTSGYRIEPSVWSGIAFFRKNSLKLNIGTRYLWFDFSEFPSAQYHEIAPATFLTLRMKNHRLQFGLEWKWRHLPVRQETEWERKVSVIWHYQPPRFLSLLTGIEWSHQEGEGQWTDLDESLFPVGFKVAAIWFYLKPVYIPGLMRFKDDDEYRFYHVFSFTVGFVPIPFLDISLSYRYEELFSAGKPNVREPNFVRHLGSITIALTGERELRPAGHREIQEEIIPVTCRRRVCTFRIRKENAAAVYVCGSFNNWKEKQYRLTGPDFAGIWKIEIALPSGRHRYVFVVDGEILIPKNAGEYENDGMGSRNAVVTVFPE